MHLTTCAARKLPLALGFAVLIGAGSARSQSALEKELAKLVKPTAMSSQATGNTSNTAAAGWRQSHANVVGQGCSIVYARDGKGAPMIGFLGPVAELKGGAIVFMGPGIPKPASTQKTTVLLETEGDPAQNVLAIHLPVGDGGAFVVSTDMKTTVAALDNDERVRVSHGSQLVFELDWRDGHAARDFMMACLAVKAPLMQR